jgi:hypothetical protein
MWAGIHREAGWDTDHDGMPNWWEIAKGLAINSPAGDFSESNADPDMDGFTNLDDYLDWMATPHYEVPDNEQKITIDLKTLSRGYTSSPVFTVANVVNGNVMVTSGVVEFIPTAIGLGSFTFTVTDGEGASMTRKVNTYSDVLVSSVGEQESVSDIKLWPVPSHGDFSLSSSRATSSIIKIYNAVGQLVSVETVAPNSVKTLHVSTPGFYIVRVFEQSNATILSTKKVIVE